MESEVLAGRDAGRGLNLVKLPIEAARVACPQENVIGYFDGEERLRVESTEEFAAEFNRVMGPLDWEAEIVLAPKAV